MSEYKNQANRILRLLQEYAPNYVPLPDILALKIASHTRRITELRRDGHIIETRNEYTGHQRHTAYRWLGKLTDQNTACTI